MLQQQLLEEIRDYNCIEKPENLGDVAAVVTYSVIVSLP